MAIEDKNGCLHSEENGRFVNKTDPNLLNALSEAFGIKDSVKDKRRAVFARISKEQRLLRQREWVIRNWGHEAIDSLPALSVRPLPSIHINNNDHWARLQVMFSDYHRGACKPVEKNGIKYFNIDNTLYLTEGEYPYFRVFKAITFINTFLLEDFLKGL